MLKSILCCYSDAYILVSGTWTNTGAGTDNAAEETDERNKGVVFQNCAPHTNSISGTDKLKYIMQKMKMLLCQWIIQWNTVIIIQKHQEVYSNIIEARELIK